MLKKKDAFMSETSAQILAGMCANPEKVPSPEHAIELAEELWQHLVEKNYTNNLPPFAASDQG